MDPHQANLQPNLLLFNFPLHFNPIPTFLRVTFNCTLSFSKHVSSLKAKFFPCLKVLRCHTASSWGPSKESLFLLYKLMKLFFGPISPMLQLDGFLSEALLIIPNGNAFTKHLVMSSPATSHPPLSCFSSLRPPYLPYQSPELISLCHLMSGPFISQPPFPFQV